MAIQLGNRTRTSNPIKMTGPRNRELSQDHQSPPNPFAINFLRAVSAILVAVAHIRLQGFIPYFEKQPHSLLTRTYDSLFCGVFSVLLFFILSGYCISHPYLSRRIPMRWQSFLTARIVRISLPFLVILYCSRQFGFSGQLNQVSWSLFIELIYYFIFPLLLPLYNREAIRPLIFPCACFLAAAVYFVKPNPTGYLWGLGPIWGALWLLPAWLLGVETNLDRFTFHTFKPNLTWLLLLLTPPLFTFLHFHGGVQYKHSFPIMLLAAHLVFANELQRRVQPSPYQTLAKLGLMAYSLYLVHPVFIAPRPLGSILLIPILVAGFYYLIEFPSHRLARWLGSLQFADPRSSANTPARSTE